MLLNNLFLWLGIFLTVTMLGIVIKKPTKKYSKTGPFDNPIHTKPAFKVASIVLLLSLLIFLVTVASA